MGKVRFFLCYVILFLWEGGRGRGQANSEFAEPRICTTRHSRKRCSIVQVFIAAHPSKETTFTEDPYRVAVEYFQNFFSCDENGADQTQTKPNTPSAGSMHAP